MLEEQKRKRERAIKMREQQERMLAELKAKKEMKEKEKEEEQKRYEKKLAKAREQVKANYEQIATSIGESSDKPDSTQVTKKKVESVTDKNCLQAPDNDTTTPAKKKPDFIEPNLKAFMDRNMPKLKVFTNITDMK